MNLLEIFGNSFIVGLSGAMMPGPLLVVALARTPAHGARTGPLVTVGHGIVELLTVVILAYGLAEIVEREPMVARVIAVVGGAALLLMALLMFLEVKRKVEAPHLERKQSSDRVTSFRLIQEGMLATVSNPYWFVWWATIGSALVIASLESGPAGPPVFYVGHILSDLAWYSAVSLLLWQGKSLFAGKRYHVMIAVFAIFLLWLGGWFIFSGLSGAIVL